MWSTTRARIRDWSSLYDPESGYNCNGHMIGHFPIWQLAVGKSLRSGAVSVTLVDTAPQQSKRTRRMWVTRVTRCVADQPVTVLPLKGCCDQWRCHTVQATPRTRTRTQWFSNPLSQTCIGISCYTHQYTLGVVVCSLTTHIHWRRNSYLNYKEMIMYLVVLYFHSSL